MPQHRLTAAEALRHPWVASRGLPTEGQGAANLAAVPRTMAEYQHASRVQRAVAQLMANSLMVLHVKADLAISVVTAAWLDHLAGIFAAYDQDGDGRMARHELEAGLVALRRWKSSMSDSSSGGSGVSVFEQLRPTMSLLAAMDSDSR